MEKRKRGGQPGNQNAKGHGAPIGNQNACRHGAPFGNLNAMKHGQFSMYAGTSRRPLYLAVLNYMDRNGIPASQKNMIACASILSKLREVREPAGGDGALWGSVFESVLNPQEVFKVFEDIGLSSKVAKTLKGDRS